MQSKLHYFELDVVAVLLLLFYCCCCCCVIQLHDGIKIGKLRRFGKLCCFEFHGRTVDNSRRLEEKLLLFKYVGLDNGGKLL
jgi:hypothetical protein